MMTTTTRNNRSRRTTRTRFERVGFTLIEMLVSIAIGLMAMFMIYNFLGSTRMHYMYGTVNLQNLQDARLAINYLRRDFSSSCFFVSPSDAFKTVQLARMSGFKSGTQWSGGNSHLIEITNKKLSFHRFDFGIDQAMGTPTVKLVEYEF
ncbi:MAG TPA: prepilin-type N-terminal cleavage/methylation domain-containing protein, partial [Candidatus Ozemobacteraceae bacterium]|nr:prepilin-type N-terminal cleavage/methylation domain-containing protein [Candidatus Ozemobacteraceae bacterium]